LICHQDRASAVYPAGQLLHFEEAGVQHLML
jgi:hypothetical protein